jgi:hypothetical protein
MKSICKFIVVAALTGGAGAETDVPLPKMVEVGKAVAESRPAALARTSADFERALKEALFSPSPSIRAELKAVQNASTKLLANLGEGKFQKDSDEAKAVATAVKSTLDKLDSLIEENYQEQPGVANVSPPPGVPNAAAGMNPHAITDPKLRQQYQDAIEKESTKQKKNAQQRELRITRRLVLMNIAALDSWRSSAGLSKEELVVMFSNEDKSRKLLSEMVAPVATR